MLNCLMTLIDPYIAHVDCVKIVLLLRLCYAQLLNLYCDWVTSCCYIILNSNPQLTPP